MTNKDNDNVRILMLFMPEIRQCLENKRWPELKQILLKIPPMDLAEGWGNFSPRERIIIFKLFDIRLATELFESLRLEDQSFLLNNLEDGNVARILNDMAPDERANLFKDLPRKVYKKFFRLMSKEEAADVAELLAYDEGAAGAVMTTEFVELRKDMTARGAILKLQDCLRFDSSADVHTVYVTDENNILKGAVELQDLIKAPADMPIKDIMTDVDHIKIGVDNANAEVARRFKKYDLLDAPVVDVSDKLIGVITVDDIVDLIDKEATKDIYEVGKMSAEEGQIISYATATVGELLKRRSGWLIFLLVFDFLTGTVLKSFEHALSSVVSLAFFIPMLLDTGGNAGNQTSITIIRGLATGDVSLKGAWRVARIELLTALMMGVIVGVVAFLRAILLQQEMLLALVVGLTMFVIVLLAISTGIFLPLISKRFGLDPAVLAGPITTSVVDVLGLIIYFKIAQFCLPALR